MIITENLGNNLVKTYSDANLFIERNGVRYVEAIDPIGLNRTYTETFEKIVTDENKLALLEWQAKKDEETQQQINNLTDALIELASLVL